MTIVQEFAAYCEANDMPSDEVMSASFFVNRKKIDGLDVTIIEWNDLLDFVSPEVAPTVCPIPR